VTSFRGPERGRVPRGFPRLMHPARSWSYRPNSGEKAS